MILYCEFIEVTVFLFLLISLTLQNHEEEKTLEKAININFDRNSFNHSKFKIAVKCMKCKNSDNLNIQNKASLHY